MTSNTAPVDPYDVLSTVYDHWVREFDHSRVIRYAQHFLDQGFAGLNVLDTCAGTGTLTNLLASLGAQVTSIDRSNAMIEIAREKADRAGLSKYTTFITGDITAGLPSGRYDISFCTLDSLNYLEPASIPSFFSAIRRVLRAGGLFVFDINSEKKLRETFGNSVYTEDHRDYAYIWKNRLNERMRFIDFEITIFIREEAGTNSYTRHDEKHRQFILSEKDLSAALETSQLSVLHRGDNYAMADDPIETGRISFVARAI